MSNAPPDLRGELEDLYARYAAALDEGPLADWPALFIESGRYRITTHENEARAWPLSLILCESRSAIADRVTSVEQLMMTIPRRTRHMIGGVRTDWTSEDACAATANFAVFETLPGQLTQLYATGLYRDRVVRSEGRLAFAEKTCVCDGELIRNSLIVPL